MVEKMNGLSLDFIIHPGETIKEALEDRQMNQEELAIRTGFSPKHISEVVNGKKGISPSFAKALEYVFGIPIHGFLVGLLAQFPLPEHFLLVSEIQQHIGMGTSEAHLGSSLHG